MRFVRASQLDGVLKGVLPGRLPVNRDKDSFERHPSPLVRR
jgi:hypothetical protein